MGTVLLIYFTFQISLTLFVANKTYPV